MFRWRSILRVICRQRSRSLASKIMQADYLLNISAVALTILRTHDDVLFQRQKILSSWLKLRSPRGGHKRVDIRFWLRLANPTVCDLTGGNLAFDRRSYASNDCIDSRWQCRYLSLVILFARLGIATNSVLMRREQQGACFQSTNCSWQFNRLVTLCHSRFCLLRLASNAFRRLISTHKWSLQFLGYNRLLFARSLKA